MKDYNHMLKSALGDMIIHISKRPKHYHEDIVFESAIYDWHECLTDLHKLRLRNSSWKNVHFYIPLFEHFYIDIYRQI